MTTLYVLQLEQNKYYVGRTNDIDKRLVEHAAGKGAEWTVLYKVVKVVEIIKDCKPQDEDAMTITYMKKYGIENVRGGTFCSIILNNETLKLLTKMINTQESGCYKCGEKGHYANECGNGEKLALVTCYKCGEKGHYANRCYNRAKGVEEKQKINKSVEREKVLEVEKQKEQKIKSMIALKSHHGKWLCFDSPARLSIVSADRDKIGEFEKFVIEYFDNDEVKLFSPKHKTYLAATKKGDVYQTNDAANSDTNWKIDVISTNLKNGKIDKIGFLHSIYKKYLCSERLNLFGYGKVIANRENLKSFETWEICYL